MYEITTQTTQLTLVLIRKGSCFWRVQSPKERDNNNFQIYRRRRYVSRFCIWWCLTSYHHKITIFHLLKEYVWHFFPGIEHANPRSSRNHFASTNISLAHLRWSPSSLNAPLSWLLDLTNVTHWSLTFSRVFPKGCHDLSSTNIRFQGCDTLRFSFAHGASWPFSSMACKVVPKMMGLGNGNGTTPFKYGHFWYQFVKFLGCKCINHHYKCITLRIQIPPDRIGFFGFQSHPKRIGMDRGNPGFLGHIWILRVNKWVSLGLLGGSSHLVSG